MYICLTQNTIMKRKIILPFDDYPIPSMYHNVAFPMGIIQGNAKGDITPWLCGKFLNCYFNANTENQFNLSYAYSYFGEDKILFGEEISLIRAFYGILGFDILSLFRRMLSTGHYIQGNYNEEYIPGKWAYQNAYYYHDFLLIGYDDIKKVFISVGYLKDQKFQRYEIQYSDMLQSILTLKIEKLWFKFWSYNPDVKFVFNLSRVISELSDYLNSTTSLCIYKGDNIYGLSAIAALGKLFEKQAEQRMHIDFRYSRGLMEHKYLMYKRIVYMAQQNFGIHAKHADRAEQVYRLSERVHLLGLKHMMTGNREIICSIQALIVRINEMELAYLSDVLDKLIRLKQEDERDEKSLSQSV